jgi:hypothetical protein
MKLIWQIEDQDPDADHMSDRVRALAADLAGFQETSQRHREMQAMGRQSVRRRAGFVAIG